MSKDERALIREKFALQYWLQQRGFNVYGRFRVIEMRNGTLVFIQ